MVLENQIILDIVNVIEKRYKLPQAIIRDKKYEALSLRPAAQTSDKSAVTKEGMLEIVEELKQEYDYVLIDCPAGIEQGFENAIAGADEARSEERRVGRGGRSGGGKAPSRRESGGTA